MKNNCDYCNEDKDKKLCERCSETYICEECYCVYTPYEDDPFYLEYVCRDCYDKLTPFSRIN